MGNDYMITFRKFDKLTISKSEWAVIHQYRRQVHSDDTPDDPIINDSTFEEQMKGQIIMLKMKAFDYGIHDDKKLVGLFSFVFFNESSPAYKTNEKIVMFQIEMLKEYRKRGIGSKALKILVDTCEKYNKEIFITNSQIPETNKFFDSIGATIAQRAVEKRLAISNLDWVLIDQWINEGESINPETKVENYVGPIPDEYINEFVTIYNESANSLPKDKLESGDMKISIEEFRKKEQIDLITNVVTLTTLAIEKSGEISGFTILKKFPGKETQFDQNSTGVLMKYRGKKIGKLVKASMLKFVKDNYPNTRAILTKIAESNEAMIAINQKLGFKKHREYVTAQVSLQQLKSYLISKPELDYVIENSR